MKIKQHIYCFAVFGLAFAWIFVSPSALFGQTSAVRHSQVRIYISSNEDFLALAAAGLVFDHIDRNLRSFDAALNNTELELLRRTSFRYEVLVDDLEAQYRRRPQLTQAELNDLEARMRQQYGVDGFGFGSMGGYYTFAEAVAKLDEMRSQYPNLISAKQSIGLSIEKRNIWMVKISDNPDIDENEEEIFYSALLHAREPQSLASVLYFMFFLLENYGTDPVVTYLVDNRELYFVPVVNPDGYVFNQTTNPNGGGMWRKNRRNNGNGTFGVDLNRNFDYKWGLNNSGSSPTPSNETYRGTSPASEPETQAIQNFAIARQLTMAFNYHAYANTFNFPFGYGVNTFTPDHQSFVAFSKEMSRFNNYEYGTPYQTLGYTTNGYSNDWFYGEQTLKGKVFSWTVEVGGNGDGFWPSPSRIVPLAQGNIYNNLVLAWGVGGAPPAVDIVATPNNPPITVPAQGGSFTFHVELQNNSGADLTVQIWANVVLGPDRVSEAAFVMNVPLARGQSFAQNLTQNISSQLAPREYTYRVSTGFFTKSIDRDSFVFTKQGP